MLTFTPMDARGLRWLKARCAAWQLNLKRQRKYAMPRGAPFTEQEAHLLRVLLDLEQASEQVLKACQQET